MAKKRTNYNSKSLRLLDKWKFNYWRTETYNPFSGKKTDLFNIIDYIAITKYSVIGFQFCGVDFAPHVKKVLEYEKEQAENWLISPNRYLILIGWRKLKQRRHLDAMVFKPRIGIFYMEDNQIKFEEKKCI